MNNKNSRVFIISVLVILGAVIALNFAGQPGGTNLISAAPRELSVSEFESMAQQKQVKSATWQVETISGELTQVDAKGANLRYTTHAAPYNSTTGNDLYKRLLDDGVSVKISDPPLSQGLASFLGIILMPIMLLGIFYFFVLRPAQNGGNQAMNFGRSRAKRAGENTPKVTFEDVAGVDEAKEELFEIVDFLRNTKKYVALGARIPKGVLLTGPPGVGKTHLARAIAGEAGVPFFHISGSDFVEMFVGVGAARVRDLFETAKAHRPCLIFVDEIDAVGRQRGAGLGGGHDEREQTLNQLLVEMDGFDTNGGVVMIAATNRPDVLDPALLRPGRFDRQVVVEAPDARGREAILKIHAKGKPLDGKVDLGVVAKRTPGFTGADLANSLNEAALLAARHNRTKIAMDDVEEAVDRVMVGPARRSRVMIEKDRLLTAYHEAGHAVVGESLEHCDPIHKVTILPRGMALGITWSLPPEDSYSQSKSELLDDITMCLGGLVAEETVFGERWTGAYGDLQSVTRIARAMVTSYGMSDKLGTLAIGRKARNPFLGREFSEDRDYSEEVARMIDEEVRHMVDNCRQRAEEILIEKRPQLDAVAKALLERETLDREEFLIILNGGTLPEIVKLVTPTTPSPDAPVEVKQTQIPPRLEPGPA